MVVALHNYKKRPSKYTHEIVEGWRKLMKENGWNRRELAEKLGINVQTIQNNLIKDAYGEL